MKVTLILQVIEYIKLCQKKKIFNDWHEVSKEQAREYISDIMKRMPALKKSEQIAFVEEKRLRGITVKELFETQ